MDNRFLSFLLNIISDAAEHTVRMYNTLSLHFFNCKTLIHTHTQARAMRTVKSITLGTVYFRTLVHVLLLHNYLLVGNYLAIKVFLNRSLPKGYGWSLEGHKPASGLPWLNAPQVSSCNNCRISQSQPHPFLHASTGQNRGGAYAQDCDSSSWQPSLTDKHNVGAWPLYFLRLFDQ